MNSPIIVTTPDQLQSILKDMLTDMLEIRTMGKENYLDAKETAALMKISRSQLTKLTKDPDFPASCSPDSRLLFKESEIREYLDKIAKSRKAY